MSKIAPALAELGLSRIGTITAGEGVRIRDLDGHDKDITFQGYEHRAEAPTPAR